MRQLSLASFRNRFVTLAIADTALIAVAGCYGQPLSTREKGTLAGDANGAGSGAIVGAGTGMAIGNSIQNNENHQQYAD
jgi:hypothetical protein